LTRHDITINNVRIFFQQIDLLGYMYFTITVHQIRPKILYTLTFWL